jgi:hypothetical protein
VLADVIVTCARGVALQDVLFERKPKVIEVSSKLLTGHYEMRVGSDDTGYLAYVCQERYSWPVYPVDISLDGLLYGQKMGVKRLAQADLRTLPKPTSLKSGRCLRIIRRDTGIQADANRSFSSAGGLAKNPSRDGVRRGPFGGHFSVLLAMA